MTRRAVVFAAALLVAGRARADLASAKAEPNLEKRSDKALDNARDALDGAEKAYNDKGDLTAADAALTEVGDSVELSYESLLATGKNPSKKPKHFKRAEIKTREMMRRLDDFRARMGADEREHIDQVRHRLQKVHDALLEGIMGGGKKK